MKKQYCHSGDGELYCGAFDSEQEALDDARETYLDDEQCYIGTAKEPELRWCTNEENIIKSIAELAKMIDETVKLWIKKENIKPQCYSVLDGHIVSFNEKSEN